MKYASVILLLFFSYLASAQVLQVLDKKGRIIDQVLPGKVIYKLKNNRKTYINNITRINADTIFFDNGFIQIDSLCFIDQLSNFKELVFTGINSLNYALIPFQFGLTSILFLSADNYTSNDNIISATVFGFFATAAIRGSLLFIRNYTVFDSKLEQRNCTFKYSES